MDLASRQGGEITLMNLSSEASILSSSTDRVHVTVNVKLQTTPANNTRGMTVSKHNANETGANYSNANYLSPVQARPEAMVSNKSGVSQKECQTEGTSKLSS